MHTTEIRIARDEASVEVIVDEQRSSISVLDLVPFLDTDPSRDIAGFGNMLARRAFDRAQVDILGAVAPASRILLTVADQRLATIPWETLRIGGGGDLLAARCTFTRWTAAERPAAKVTAGSMLNLVAIPVAPIDGYQPVLATEREYRGLQSTIVASGSAVRLVRVRPPTLDATAAALREGVANGVFFMGHSDSSDGRSMLAFEDASGRTRLVEARELASILTSDVAFVVLNSCWSAKAGSATELGNIARGLVQRGIPHALGMQSELPDDAAILLSRELMRALVAGSGFEEAVRRVRTFFMNSPIADGAWIATVPVCYTSCRIAPLPIAISRGAAEIEPSPAVVAARTDLSALPASEELVGRGAETSAVLDTLSSGRPVVLHGLGGIGKTSLARAAAERVAWRYEDRVLAFSFETLDESGFVARLTRFYGLDDDADLIDAAMRTKALLVLDNVETLFDSMGRGAHSTLSVGELIRRLGGGKTDLLLTSRLLPPESWNVSVVNVRGLSTTDGAELFRSLLSAERRSAAPSETARRLSVRVEGHPLGIRLLAAQFALGDDSLERFLERLEEELAHATELQEVDRQETLDACMRYSVERLDPVAQSALETLALFQAPFLEVFASQLLAMPEETFSATLDDLVRHGLVSRSRETWDQDTITLYEIHQTLRWYLAQHRAASPLPEVLQRYASVLLSFANVAENTDAVTRSRWMRRILFSSLPDFDIALSLLDPMSGARLAYLLVRPLEFFGQIAKARRLAQHALKIAEAHDDALLMTAALLRIGDLMNKMSEPIDTVLAVYDRAVALGRRVGPESGAASQIHIQIGYLQFTTGQAEESLASYQLAREALDRAVDIPQELRRIKEAECDCMIARSLTAVGRDDEAMDLFDSAVSVLLRGSSRAASVALDAMAALLDRQKRHQEALRARERAVSIMQELDVRAAAVIRGNLATTLVYLGRIDEARALFEDALTILKKKGDALEAASVAERLAILLHGTGQPAGAIRSLWDAYRTYETLRRERDAQRVVAIFRDMKATTGVRVFSNWWRSTIGEPEPRWLADVQNDPEAPLGRARLAQKALTTAIENTIVALQPGNDEWKASWRQMLVEIGAGFERDGETVLSQFNAALLALVDGQPTQIPRDHPYYIPFNELLDAARVVTGRETGADPELSQMTDVIRELLNASAPERVAQIIRDHHELIVRHPEMAGYLRMRREQEYSKGNHDYAKALQVCASLLDGLSVQEAGDVAERVEQAMSREDASPQGRAQRAARAAFGDASCRQGMAAELGQFIAASASDDERLFYGALRMGVVEGRADFLVSFESEELVEAWDVFQRAIVSGGVDPSVFQQITASVNAALALEADSAAVSACRRTLATMRNEAIVEGLAQFADLVDALAAVVDACASGADIFKLDLGGMNLQGTYSRVWREIIAQVRQRRRPPMRPELRRAISAYLQREDQTGTIEILRSHAGELVSDEAIDELWLLSIQQRGVKSFEDVLKTHLRLLEWARQYGLAAAVTRDVVMSFAAENDPALLTPVFEVSADLLSIEVADEVFLDLERYQEGNPSSRVALFRKRQMFRRIVERGATTVFADDARLAYKREAARALIVGVVQQVLRPEAQEAHVTSNEALLYDPEIPPLIVEVAEQLAAVSMEHPHAEDIVHAIGVYMQILDRCRTDGVAATFAHRKRLLSWLLEILNAPREGEREVARRIDAEFPGALTSDEAFELAFQLQEHMRDQQNWPAFKTARRIRFVLRRWKESDLGAAFDEGDAVEAGEGKLAEVLTALSETDDQAAIRAIIEQHAGVLLHPATDRYFDDMLAEMRRSAPQEVQAYFFRLRAFLRRCREIGVSAAFGDR